MGFVLVQHLNPEHESALTQLLARATKMPVREITNNQRVEANRVYVTAIKAEGGITFAQDDSARYDSMPRSAVAAGCVDFVLSPENIAKELARIAAHPYVVGQPPESLPPAEDERADGTAHANDDMPLPSGGRGRAERTRARGAENGFEKVLLLLRNYSGVDFSLYKSSTLERRITRRMVLNEDTLESYAHFLQGNAKELDALYSDVLLSVTSFFRNPEAFDALKRTVFPQLLQRRGDPSFRAWVLGCSTGQEAYSIAMAFVEAAENASRLLKLQVFATDLNDALLDKARHGLYAKGLMDDVSPERLRRFFVEEEGGYPLGPRAELDPQREADRITVNRFAPPGVLIDAELQIVQFAGRPARISSRPPASRASTC